MGLRVQSYGILFAPPYSFSVHFTSPFSPFAVLRTKKGQEKAINADWGIRQKEKEEKVGLFAGFDDAAFEDFFCPTSGDVGIAGAWGNG